ncbi:hypothetical protein [Caldifermentibacillus hisashii]|uniref:hypothetical protein n=1 Tax=Caldifermentibacillus hisashii TaxID=996558 RepID=UPI001C0F5352|nr:hypothetical protein [Caldifermentibacillus hisashii]MBU5341644.1 hypothetical protein [Caldifermentibacillus hisashii]
MATKLFLVVTFARETPLFSDETLSRRHFELENSTFWRRDHFSSTFLGENLVFLATRLFLVTFLSRKTPFFDDETTSRRHFCSGNSTFWRRDLFSSPFWGGKLTFLATRLFLVVTFGRETPFFGDETSSRHPFWAKNTIFWRRDLFSSTFVSENLVFLTTRRQDEMPNLASINRKLAHKISHTT